MTKKQKRTRAAAGARKRSLAKAVRSLLKKANPSAKITGAKVVKLKGGALRITPIKDNPRSSFDSESAAERFAGHIGRHQRAKIVKKGNKYVVVWTKSGYRRAR